MLAKVRSGFWVARLVAASALVLSACQASESAAPDPTLPVPEPPTRPQPFGSDSSGRSLGGTMVYALQSDPGPIAPTEQGCGVPCRQLLSVVSDPLVALGRDGSILPILIDRLEARDDFFTWEMGLRPGIRFHDGTELDSSALAAHLEGCRTSPLSSAWFAPILEIETTGESVILHLSEPWASFPEMLIDHPCNLVLAGSSTPERPVGTGPFAIGADELGQWPLAVRRNDDYWRGQSGSTGEGLPLLDRIEFTVQPLVEEQVRLLNGGAVDLYHSSLPSVGAEPDLASALGTDSYQLVFNVEPRSASQPLRLGSIEGCRVFLAQAIDFSRLPVANHLLMDGPYLDEVDLVGEAAEPPEQDFGEQCGPLPEADQVGLIILTSDDPVSLVLAQSLSEQWNARTKGVVTVDVEVVDSGALGRRAVLGEFDALLWSSSSGVHPESSFPWWHSSSVFPVGQIGLNVGRFVDADIDEALKLVRVSPDESDLARVAIAEAFERRGWIVWLNRNEWSVTASESVVGLDDATAPGGELLESLVGGQHWLGQVWCAQATC